MLLMQLDMCSALDMFAFANEGFISYRIDAKRKYIVPNKVRHIESASPTYRQKYKKQEQE